MIGDEASATMAQNPSFPWAQSQSAAEREDRNESLQLQKLRAVFSAFQDSGAGSSLALDLLLHELAEEARSFLGGSSCAIALRVPENHFVCRATAGKSAPALGTRIEAQDGLSAECVYTSKQQICQDIEVDARVDAEMCRAMSIRSLAIIPLFLQQKLIGILEVFAPRLHAFDPATIQQLTNLGHRIVETVAFAEATLAPQPRLPETPRARVEPWMAATSPERTDVEVSDYEVTDHEITQHKVTNRKLTPPEPTRNIPSPIVEVADKSLPSPNLHPYSFQAPASTARPLRTRRNLGLALVALTTGLVAAAGLLWLPTENSHPILTESAVSPVKPVLPDSDLMTTAANSTARKSSPRKPQPGIPKAQPDSPRGKDSERNDARERSGGLVVYEKGKVVYRALPGSGQLIGSVTSAAETEKLGDTTENTPGSGRAQSALDDITGGKLIHQVAPIIPPEVIGLHLPEEVLLEGIIGQDGTVRNIRFIRGDARLSEAAIEAVRQWRYEPFRSNGEPVDMLSSLTVRFR